MANNTELPESVKCYLGWTTSYRAVVAEKPGRQKVLIKLLRQQETLRGVGVSVSFRHSVQRSPLLDAAAKAHSKQLRVESSMKDAAVDE